MGFSLVYSPCILAAALVYFLWVMLIVWALVGRSAVCFWFSKHMNMSHFFPHLILLLWIWRHKIPNKCWYLSIYHLLTNWQYFYIQHTHFSTVCYCEQWRHLHCDETVSACMVIVCRWVFDYIKTLWLKINFLGKYTETWILHSWRNPLQWM